MADVWAATHLLTRKAVALKLVKPSAKMHPSVRARLVREARAACAVKHPSVVAIHDVLELEDGAPVLVMDLLKGESLGHRLDREKVLSLAEVARILLPVVSAVGSAHAVGIVHRDLKPDNIFLSVEPDGRADVKVLDFGIAKLTATEGDAAHTGGHTGTGSVFGTPYYMSPEQIYGERDADHRTDIWALGVIMYEMLAGKRPTQGANVGQIMKVITQEGITPLAEVLPAVPAEIADLVTRMLARDRTKRPTDLREVRTVLQRYAELSTQSFGEPMFPEPAPPTPRAPDPLRLAATHTSEVSPFEPTVALAALERPTGEEATSVRQPTVSRSGPSRALKSALAIIAVSVAGLIVIATRGDGSSQRAADTGASSASLSVPSSLEPSPLPTEAARAPISAPSEALSAPHAGAIASPVEGVGRVIGQSSSSRPLPSAASAQRVRDAGVPTSGNGPVPVPSASRASGGVIETAPF